MSSLRTLLNIASQPLVMTCPDRRAIPIWGDSIGSDDLVDLLSQRNGFVAFENALQVFPCGHTNIVPNIVSWNEDSGWRRFYDFAFPVVFFAQDLFASQFGIGQEGIVRLNPETGLMSRHSATLDDWARTILDDYGFQTGWPLAREWQKINGPLPMQDRLLPRLPFVLGGDYVVENLIQIESFEAMEKLGQLYRQIRDTPDGAVARITGWIV